MKPRSLISLFAPPEDYRGFFGWIVGYSADRDFLENAALSFTRMSAEARVGRICLAVLLDPSNKSLAAETSGVAHLPLISATRKPFRLLHAKFALLGFVNPKAPDRWLVRLVVSTGNWTRQTAEESLDLAWKAEISSEDADAQNRADVAAAWDLLNWLKPLFDTRLLDAVKTPNPSRAAMEKLENCLNRLEKPARGDGRFFDNRKRSALDSVVSSLRNNFKSRPNNYLAMGSGFFETPKNDRSAPAVPLNVINALRKNEFLTDRGSRLDLFVNRDACQGVATGLDALRAKRITVREAAMPPAIFGENPAPRFLHAKFIFCAQKKDDKNLFLNSWLYLGSANLTDAGFARSASGGGNLETGVVLFPPKTRIVALKARAKAAKDDDNAPPLLRDLLPVQWEKEIMPGDNLACGEKIIEVGEYWLAPPVAFFYWRAEEDGGSLIPGDASGEFGALDPKGELCDKNGERFLWPSRERPPWVEIIWTRDGAETRASIPTLDEYGRIGAPDLVALSIDDKLAELALYPNLPETDEEDEELAPFNAPAAAAGNGSRFGEAADYPIRRMTRFIDAIAVKQCAQPETNWDNWLVYLEQSLGQVSGDAAVSYFREETRLNPLYPLRLKYFRPDYTLTDPRKAAAYANALTRAEKKWGVFGLPGLGEGVDE